MLELATIFTNFADQTFKFTYIFKTKYIWNSLMMFILKIKFQNSVSTFIKHISPLRLLPPRFQLHWWNRTLVVQSPTTKKKKMAEQSGEENFWSTKKFARTQTSDVPSPIPPSTLQMLCAGGGRVYMAMGLALARTCANFWYSNIPPPRS